MQLFQPLKRSDTESLPVIIFDVGGVILDWDPIKFGKTYQSGNYEKQCEKIFGGEIWKKFDRGDVSYEELLDYCESLGLSRAEGHTLLQAAFDSLKPNQPVIDLVNELKATGHPVFCLTNGSKEYYRYVTSPGYEERHGFNLNHLFSRKETIVSANEKCAKPEAKIYHLAKEQFKLAGQVVIFIDDNQMNLVGASESVGWRPIFFESLKECRQKLQGFGVKIPDSAPIPKEEIKPRSKVEAMGTIRASL